MKSKCARKQRGRLEDPEPGFEPLAGGPSGDWLDLKQASTLVEVGSSQEPVRIRDLLQ